MDVDIPTPVEPTSAVDTIKGRVTRDKTCPFLIRAFVKVGGFHRITSFEDGSLPTADEHQVFTWKDATLRELLTTLRDTSTPSSPAFAELKHPLARFAFKTIYADGGHKSRSNNAPSFRYVTKELGMVYSRDILGEPGSFSTSTGPTAAPRLAEDEEPEPSSEDKTLEDLRFSPGDFLLVSIILPKSAMASATAAASTTELNIKGANASSLGGPLSAVSGSVGWKRDPAIREKEREREREGRGANSANWRGGSDAPSFLSSRGRGGRGRGGGRGGGDFAGRDRDFPGRDRDRDAPARDAGGRDFAGRDSRDREPDRRPPPPRRPGARASSFSRSRSRSRSPVGRGARRGGRRDSPPPRRGGRNVSVRRSRSPVARRGGRDDSPPARRGGRDHSPPPRRRGGRDSRSRSMSRSRSRSVGKRRRYD